MRELRPPIQSFPFSFLQNTLNLLKLCLQEEHLGCFSKMDAFVVPPLGKKKKERKKGEGGNSISITPVLFQKRKEKKIHLKGKIL